MIGRKWTFEVGGKTKDELLLKFSENKISFNAYGILLFMSEHFLTNKNPKNVTVVALRVDELGFEAG
ncbi:helicase, partial [Vibrio vulnificus]